MTSIWQIAAIQIGNFSAFLGLQSAIKRPSLVFCTASAAKPIGIKRVDLFLILSSIYSSTRTY